MSSMICFRELSFDDEMIFDRVSLFIQFHKLDIEILSWRYKEFQQHKHWHEGSINRKIKIPFDCDTFKIKVKPSIINLSINTQTMSMKVAKTLDPHYLTLNTELGSFTLLYTFQHEMHVPLNMGSEISASTMNDCEQMYENQEFGMEKLSNQQKTRNQDIAHIYTVKKKKENRYSFSEGSLSHTPFIYE